MFSKIDSRQDGQLVREMKLTGRTIDTPVRKPVTDAARETLNSDAVAMAQTRILIVHRDHLCGQSLSLTLEAQGRFSQVHWVPTLAEAMSFIERHGAGVLLIESDLLPSSPSALVHMADVLRAGTKVIIFGVEDAIPSNEDFTVLRRHSGMQELVNALARAECPPPAPSGTADPQRNGTDRRCSGHDTAGPSEGVEKLTIRQREILELIDNGLTNKEIATRLGLSLHTVKNHIHALLAKLDVESRHAAVNLLPNNRRDIDINSNRI